MDTTQGAPELGETQRPAPVAQAPILYSDALASGFSRAQLRGRRFRHGPRSVYVPLAARRDFILGARSWLIVMPANAALFGVTAAQAYGLPVTPDSEYHVIVPAGGVVPRRRPGLVPHEGLLIDECGMVDGLRVTTPGRTFLDLASQVGRMELVIVGDAMVRRGLTTVDELRSVVAGVRRRRGIALAREAAGLVRPRVDSPSETRVRLIIVDNGLPCPETNVDVFDDHGGWIGRPDLAYLLLKLAIQYEGDVHRLEKRRWRADVARDEVLLDHGWDVLRVTARDLSHPDALCHRIRLRMERQRQRLQVR
jgi:hypothetical protein